MKKTLTTILAVVVALVVWFLADPNRDSRAQQDNPSLRQMEGPGASTQAPSPSGQAPTPAKQPARSKPVTKPAESGATPVEQPGRLGPRSVIVKLPNGGEEDIGATLQRIDEGVKHPHHNDGSVFGNYERRLPRKPRGHYREYVHPTPNRRGPGARRVVRGKDGEVYYTHDHYETFVRVKLP